MTYAMIDAYCASYPKPPVAVTLDIGDTVDAVHGHQQGLTHYIVVKMPIEPTQMRWNASPTIIYGQPVPTHSEIPLADRR